MPAEPPKKAAHAAMRAQHRRLIAVGAIFVVVQALIVIFSWAALEIVNVARSYAGGEGFYSKAQKSAVIDLHRFAEAGDDKLFGEFERHMMVPIGDRTAREELEKPQPDFGVVRSSWLRRSYTNLTRDGPEALGGRGVSGRPRLARTCQRDEEALRKLSFSS